MFIIKKKMINLSNKENYLWNIDKDNNLSNLD